MTFDRTACEPWTPEPGAARGPPVPASLLLSINAGKMGGCANPPQEQHLRPGGVPRQRHLAGDAKISLRSGGAAGSHPAVTTPPAARATAVVRGRGRPQEK